MKNITKKLLVIIFFLISFEGVEAQVQSCNSMPEPVAYTRVGTPTEKRVEETAVVRGITVTRILEVRGSAGDKIMYSNQETIPGDTQSDETYCGKSRKNTFGGKKYPFMDSNKVSKITYKFSKPVIDVEVFLAAFGYSGTRKSGGWQSYPHIDVVKITTNKGTATLHARSTCGENNLLTVSGNEISSIDHKTTDAKIGITSTEPFTELVLQVIEKQRQTGGYGFFVEICLASIIADASCDTMPNAQFGREQNATATMGGVKVTRSYTGKGSFSNAGEPRGPIYCQSSYSGDLPWVLNSNNNIKTLTYTFEEPVTEAELWFVGMGGGNGISAYDKAKVSVNCDNITLREAFRCNGSSVDVTNPSANSRLISVSNPTKVTDIAYKVTSSKPFTEITIEDSSDAQAEGYLVEMCPTSVKKANIITVNTALTEQTVCDNTGNAPSYLAKATITPTYAGGTLNYELQAKKKGSTTWETITTNNSVTNDLTYQPSDLKALAYNEATVRIKYTYSNSAKLCGTLTKYSNEVKLNVNASTTITTQPATSVAYCKDATPTALSVTATGQGTLSYQWYSNTTNNNTGGTLITGANAATYTPPTTTAGSTYYYVAVTGTCGTVTSTVARVQVLTASDIITINTPNYNNINGICNTNSTISAQATIAPNYSNKIKNLGGGNFFAYQLEYRKTPTSPWENYYNQVYSNNGNGWTRTFSINPNNTPSGATFRVRYTADIVGLCDNLTVYSNEFTYTKQAVTTITTQPATSVTYCKDATTTALNVVATGEGTLAYQWYSNTTNNNTGGSLITGANAATYTPSITATGTTYYYAVVTGSCGVATSTVAKVDVLTPPEVTQIIATPPAFKQGESASVVFTIKGTPNAQVTYNINGAGTQVVTLNSSGTYTLPSRTVNQTTILNVTKVKLGACEQNYTDKSGGILATTAKCTTKPASQFATASPNEQTAVMNGVTVTRTYSKPSATTLVYGSTDNNGYCSGTPYHNYTIIHTNPSFSPKVIYTFSQPITSAEVWLMIMGSPNTRYDKVKLSTNNGIPTFTKVYDCAEGKGQAGAALSNGIVTSQDRIITDVAVRITSNTPFTQLIVEDINGADSSGVLVELCPTSITPAETISITTQPQSQTICADKMATFTSKAQLKDATGNIQYKWQQSSNGATWTDIPASTGAITSGGTASLTIDGTTNYKYRVVYTYQFAQGIVVTATSQEATLTKLPAVALPTLTGNRTLCPTATNNTVSFANYVTAPTGTTLLWYTAPTATVSSTTAPVINTHITTRTTQTAYVRALSTTGCTSGIVTVTLTVDDTTAPTFNAPAALNIVCNSTTATTAISNWLGTATATDTCGAIATITNDYNTPADLCTVPGGIITVTFVAKDTFGNTQTRTSTIHLGVTPLVVKDDSFTVPDGLRTQTTISVLDNDSLGGTKPTAGAGGTVTITNVTGATPINGGNVPILNPNDGKVTIPANTPAGTYTITYKECETLNLSSNCRTATAEIKVGTPTITVTPETLTVTPSTATQTIPNILNNDKIGGTVTPTVGVGGNVTLTVTNPNTPGKKPTLDPNTGEVTIPGNTPAGTYTITYSYCEVLNPTNCTGTQTLVVTVGAATLTVQNDSFTVPDGLTTQTTISVLDNDSLGGTKPTAGSGGTVTITNVVPATPINGGNVPVLNPNDGKVTIPANTPAGTYTITYKECETLNLSSNCQTATAVIKVGTPTITVTPETLTVTPSTATQTIPNILNNDKIGGTVTPTVGVGGNVTLTVTNPNIPGKKPTLDPNTGEVTIPGNTPAGTYTITYSYCEVLNPTNCTGTQTLVVTVGAATLTVQNDSFTVPDGLTTQTTISVLDNDSLGGTKPTAGVGGTVTITNVTGATPINGGKVPTLDPNTGVVTIPANTPAGTYTITYKECETLNLSSNCQTATAVIKVGTPTITVTPETLTVTPSTATQTIPNILNNDKIGGTVTPTVGVGGNVTLTVTNPNTPGKKPTLDPNTGEVTIPGNTPAGTYTITYSYCEVLNPTNCTGTQTLVVTVGAATLTVQNDSFTVPDGLTTQTTISVLDNDSLGGTKPTAGSGGTVTITNVVPATPINGGNVPVLNPNDGKVTIPANTPAGIYTITYKECETLNPSSNCKTATAEIKVGTPTITVTPETLTVTPSTATQTIPNILNNDKIGGTVTPTVGVGGNVTLTVTNPIGTKVPTLDRNTGEVTIPGNTPAGTYTITYSYCEVLNPTNCTGTQTLVVTVGAATLTVQNDSFTVPDGLTTQTTISVLDNDSLGGTKPTAGVGGTVTITNVTGATPINGGKVPTLDTNTGVVTIPANTPAGTYTITYKECETLNLSSNCRTATAEIKVGTPTITVTPETLTVTPSTATQTIPNILNNDKIGGTVTPTVGVGGNVTLTVTNPNTPGKKPTLDPNTGEVTIPGNTPAGTYTITYSYCEVLNPTNCTGTQTLVVTVGAATLTVQNDSFTVPDGLTTQTTISVLDNDSLGGTKPTAGAGGTVTITNVTGATPINGGKVPTLDPNTGVVTIPANTPAGTYTITYKECETLNLSSNCQTATAVIKVGTPTITVTPETLTVTPSTATQTIPNILNNDKIGGTVTPTVGVGGNVTLTVTNPNIPGKKPTLDPNTGEVTIPGNTPAGTYTITYSYCEVLNPTNCTGTQTLVVTVGAATLTVVNDSFTVPDGLTTQTTISVLDNDSLGGTKPTAGSGGTVTITNVVPATPINGGNVPVLNPNDGKVTIPANTPAGIYTITYKECETLNPSSNCKTATAEIKVGTPTITVTPETLTVTPSTATQTIPNILNNDKIGGTVTPTVGVGGNVTLTVTNPNTPGKKPTLDPNTGEVTIPGNTPAGTYTITYSYCEVLNPTNCTGTQTLVVTVGAATLTVQNDSFTVPDGLTTQTTISVLDNDSLGGTKPTAGVGGTVTITNVTGATPINGGKVPTLDTNTGVVTIPANTPAGTYTITYKECETLNLSSNCRTATAEIKVGTPTITVTPETLTVTPSTATQTIPNILNNDKIGGTVTPTVGVGGNVTLTVTNPNTPGKKPTLDPNTGEVTIPGNTPAGTYTITYSYCEVLNPTNCTGTQTLVVTVGAATLTVQNDSFTVPDGLTTQTTISVLDNDSLGGTKPTAGVGGTVTITNVTGATPINGGKVPTLDPNTGVVTIPANTPAGTYTITYKECETLNLSSNCQTATAVIKVGTPTITVTPETLTVTPSTATQTIPNILNNDKIGGTVTPTVGVGGNVTLTVTNPNTPGKKPTLDPNTGEVTIPGNTPAGTYTITYSYCEVLNPTNCTGTQTLVVTVGAATLTVQNDSFTVPDGLTTQTTISVLDNDSLGGTKPTAGAGGTVTITNVTGATPINGGKVPTLDPNTGVVTIPANTPAGIYTITYKECETLNLSSNCQTATAVIKVGTPTITVTPETLTVTPSTATQTIPNILNNDKIGGTVTPTVGVGGNVTLTVTNPNTPGKKPTLDPNTGEVTIPGNTPAGTYTITYSYCEVLNPTNCTGTQTLVVTVGAATLTVQNDSFTVPDGLTTQTTISVLDNDSLGGTKPTAGVGGTVTITNVTGATPINGGKVPTLDPNTGVVTIPANTPAGTYTITYKECETLNLSSNCQTATAVIKVGTPTITVTPETLTVTPSTATQTIPNILNNDKIGGTVTPTVGVGGNVTLTVTNPNTPGKKPTLDPNTGEVTIPGNTPAGTYTITYSYCEVLNPTNCTGTQTLVVTVGAATLTVQNDSFTVPDGLTTQTTISVLDNDSLGGTKPTAGAGGTVTITNVTGATPINGGKVPTLDPNTGVVTIPANTPAGIYTITYKECETLNLSSNCQTATAVIKVGTPTITVTPETLTVTPSTATQTIPNILNNDKIGGTVTPTVGVGGNVTLTVTNPNTPGKKPTLDPNTGEVTIPGNTPAGTYTITYSYCEVLNPTNCTGTQTLVVTVGAATLTVVNDSFTIPDGLTTQTTISVLDNDSLGGNKPTAGVGGTVTITNVTGATPINGGKVPTLDTNTGVVTIPANTPAGTYTITYKECETLNLSSNCQTATAVIKVGTPTITVTPETLTVTPSTATQTIPNILNNDKIGGTVTPTVGVGGNVTLTVTNPNTPGKKPTLDPNTGEVTIPGNTPAGTYTITYSYCEVLNPTNCTGTQTLVVTVVGTVTPTALPIAVDDRASTAMNTPINIAVLANDTLNGATTPNVVTSPANGTVVVNADNTVEYRPHTGFVGTDTFVYEICNSAGCSSATVTVDIVNKIVPYNGMSVDGDGKNDYFHIGGIENYPNNVVRIYNRWGVKVFEVSGYDNVTRVFKGISDGRVTVEASDKLPQGTYYYVIEYYDQNNNKQSEVGWLYLKK